MIKLSMCFLGAFALSATVFGCGDDDGTTTVTDAGRDSGPAGDSGPGGDAGPIPTCAAYCALITTNCTGSNLQYADMAACIKYCSTQSGWPAGASGATSGNTIGCRTYHADVAGTSMPSIHCPHAGPSGGNTCGTWCENYCTTVANNCTGANAITFSPDCMSQCALYSNTGTSGDTSGNTVQCRIYHAGIAGENPPTSANNHCPHASPGGGGTCVDL